MDFLFNYLWVKVLLHPINISGPGGSYFHGPACLPLAYLALAIASLIWVYGDARKRGKNGVLALLFVLFTGFPLSLIWWLWLRPPLRTVALEVNSEVSPGGISSTLAR
jgi:hypothetical protein